VYYTGAVLIWVLLSNGTVIVYIVCGGIEKEGIFLC
jgi:hypothetical protein